jgi:hypothetical protein
MGELENPLPEVDQEEHPLRILSQENLTVVSTFTGKPPHPFYQIKPLSIVFRFNNNICISFRFIVCCK